MSTWRLYSKVAKQAVAISQKQALDSRTNLVRPVHLALGCVMVDGNVRRMLESMNRRYEIEEKLISLTTAPGAGTVAEPPSVMFSPIAQQGVDLSHGIAKERAKRAGGILRKGPVTIQTLDLLVGTMRKSVQISAAFADLEVPIAQFIRMADFMPVEEGDSVASPRSKPSILTVLGFARR